MPLFARPRVWAQTAKRPGSSARSSTSRTVRRLSDGLRWNTPSHVFWPKPTAWTRSCRRLSRPYVQRWDGITARCTGTTPKRARCAVRTCGGSTRPSIRQFIAAVGRRDVRAGDDPGSGIIRRTFALGKPVWISNIATDETLRRKSLVVAAGLHGAFAFPLRADKEVLGIVEFFHAEVLEPDPMLLEWQNRSAPRSANTSCAGEPKPRSIGRCTMQ